MAGKMRPLTIHVLGALIGLCLMTWSVSAQDDPGKKMQEQSDKCATEAGLTDDHKKALKDIEVRYKPSDEDLKALREAPPEKQRSMVEAKAQQVAKDMKEAFGPEKFESFQKCMAAVMAKMPPPPPKKEK